ncbi:hypothetical protein ACHQM5_004554 [Ranunculus cassubicifolius]
MIVAFGEAMIEDRCMDSLLWHACAGSMVKIPERNDKVFYFPQGHVEHSSAAIDVGKFPRMPAYLLCRVADVRFMADLETDEVFAKVGLIPIKNNEHDFDFDDNRGSKMEVGVREKPRSFAKTLTQSDANNGGGFSVPRYCAETIFPLLDYTADPPVQTVLAKDVHGKIWEFRHIYRGTPRRHLLTTGWSTFVNQKKLVAGDSIVFLRTENGDLCVGIRRAKRGIGGGHESNGNFGSGKGKVRPECVIEAATLAANGQPFEVVYYPRTSTPEFCVKATSVMEAIRVQWSSGMRFKMAFETEDSSRISWFMGTVSSVQVTDPILWPSSPWKLLQVTWDEPDLLQNVKRVSPWLVELVPQHPDLPLSPFSPPRKKLCLPQHPDFPFDSQFPLPSFSSKPIGPNSFFYPVSNETPSGIQGARHAQCSAPFSNIHLNKLQSGLFHTNPPPSRVPKESQSSDEDESICLTMGHPTLDSKKKPDNGNAPHIMLFGQPIRTGHQISLCCSRGSISPILTGNSSSDGILEETTNAIDGTPDSSSCEDDYKQETGHCKVFMQSEDIGRTLDLSVLGSYDELQQKLAYMFGVEPSEMQSRVLYHDETGAVKNVGEEDFSKVVNTAKRLTIPMDLGNDNRGR